MKGYMMTFTGIKGPKVQTCVLPQSNFQPLCVQSRTHFYSGEGCIFVLTENLKIEAGGV